jgi:hypothetical protein
MAREWRWSFLTLLLGCLSQTTEAVSIFNINRFHLQEPLDTYREMLLSPSAEAADVIDRPATDWQALSDARTPFFTSKDSFRHKGLGLSIASGIISNHRGRLILDDSTPDTRLRVELPRTRQAAEPLTKPP